MSNSLLSNLHVVCHVIGKNNKNYIVFYISYQHEIIYNNISFNTKSKIRISSCPSLPRSLYQTIHSKLSVEGVQKINVKPQNFCPLVRDNGSVV